MPSSALHTLGAGGEGGGGGGGGGGGAWWLKGDDQKSERTTQSGRAAKRARTSEGGGDSGGERGSARAKAKGTPTASAGRASSRGEAAIGRLRADWPLGARVEVLQEDDGYYGAWFEAEVRGHAAPDKVRVEYLELLEGDDEDDGPPSTRWASNEPARRLRPSPRPPASHEAWAAALEVGQQVQLQYIGGWWDVVVVERRPAGGLEAPFTVKPTLYEIEHRVGASALRPAPGWVWDVPSKRWKQVAKYEMADEVSDDDAGGGGGGGGGGGSGAGAPLDEAAMEEAEGAAEVAVDVEMDEDDA